MSETEQEPKVEQQAATTPAPEPETVKGEPFDAARAMATIEKLRAEIKELKPLAGKAKDFEQAEMKRKEAEMTEAQKAQAELEKVKTELHALRIAEMRRAVAAKVELPLAFADRLVGETPEELEADAKKLLEALPKAPKPPAISATSPGAGASQGETIEQQRKRIYGQGVDVLSQEYAKSHGGGVFWPEKNPSQ